MYSKEERAIKFVIKAFENKKRIKENIDLSFHSISVGFMLKNIGCSEDIVISGLLHDIIEDTDYNYNDILNTFDKNIADNVLILSEKQHINDFRERKLEFINRLSNADNEIILIEVADKLHNLLSDYDLWKEKGNDALATLSTTYEMNKWYYLEMQKLFNAKLNNNDLLERYNTICNLYFGE